MKKESPKTIEEAAHRMIDGEKFTRDSCTLFSWNGKKFVNSFSGEELDFSWELLDEWELAPDWRDDVSEDNPVVCWVWDNRSTNKFARAIIGIDTKQPFPFRSEIGGWQNAKPVKPSECWGE